MVQVSKINGISIPTTSITGYTYDGINTFTISQNDGVNFTAQMTDISATTFTGGSFIGDGSQLTGISGIDNFYTTGTTVVGTTLYFDRTDTLSAYTADLSSFLDDTNFYVTGGTVVGSTMYLDRNDTLSAATVDVSSLLNNIDNYTTGSTLIGTTLYFDRTDTLSAYTVDLSSLTTDANTFVTGSTLVNDNILRLTRNDAVEVDQDLTIERQITFGSEQFTLNTASRVTLTPGTFGVLRFAGVGPIDEAGISFVVPTDYKDGAEFSYTWRSDTTSTGNTATTFFDLYTGDTNNTGSLLTSTETFSVSDTPEATANVFIFSPSVNPTTAISAGMQLHLRVYRDPSDGSDTLNDDLDMLNLIFRYNANR